MGPSPDTLATGIDWRYRTTPPLDFGDSDELRIRLDDRDRFARVTRIGNILAIVAVRSTVRDARAKMAGTDELGEWLSRHDRSPGSTVLIDIIAPAE